MSTVRVRLPLLSATVLVLAQLATVQASAAFPPSTSCQVFPADNIWNTDISSMPVHTRSTQWLSSMAASTTNLHPDFGAPPYGFPYNIVDNTHATVSVSFQYASESDPGPYPVGADTSIENGSDRHALIVNKDTCTLYELYNLAGGGSSWTAGSGAVFPLGSNALRPSGWTSADAAGLPIFPGLVRYDEVMEQGVITHALRFTVNHTRRAYTYPARHVASSLTGSSYPPMGMRVRLKANFDI